MIAGRLWWMPQSTCCGWAYRQRPDRDPRGAGDRDRGRHDYGARLTHRAEPRTKPKDAAPGDAAGEPLTTCEIDLQSGGAFKFVTKGHPEMPFVGTYREITAPDRLVFEVLGATGRVTLRDVAGKTHMTVEIGCHSAEQLEQYLKMGVDVGTSQTLDHLVAYVRRRVMAVSRAGMAPALDGMACTGLSKAAIELSRACAGRA